MLSLYNASIAENKKANKETLKQRLLANFTALTQQIKPLLHEIKLTYKFGVFQRDLDAIENAIKKPPKSTKDLTILDQRFAQFKIQVENCIAEISLQREKKSLLELCTDQVTLQLPTIKILGNKSPVDPFPNLSTLYFSPILSNTCAKIEIFHQACKQLEINRTKVLNKIHAADNANINAIREWVEHFKIEEKNTLERLKNEYVGCFTTQAKLIAAWKNCEPELLGNLFTSLDQTQSSPLQDELACQPNGHYMNKHSRLATALIPLSPPHVNAKILYMTLKEQRITILKDIDQLVATHEEHPHFIKISESISNYHRLTQNFIAKMADHDKFIATRNKLMEQLFLDNTNEIHVEFWERQTRTCVLGTGGVKVTVNNDSFRVPTRIEHMMRVLKQDFPNEDAFLKAFNRAREQKPSFWNNPLSSLTRTKPTSTVYECKEITKLYIDKDRQLKM